MIFHPLDLETFRPWPERAVTFGSDPAFFRQMIERTQPSVIIEVGTWLGDSATLMLRAAQELKLKPQLYCVDTWLGAPEFHHQSSVFNRPCHDLQLKHGYPQVYYQFLSNMIHRGLMAQVVPVPMDSRGAATWATQHQLQAELIFIDGAHEYDAVAADLLAWRPLVRPGGILCGHDWDLRWGGVKAAVTDVLGAVETNGSYWIKPC